MNDLTAVVVAVTNNMLIIGWNQMSVATDIGHLCLGETGWVLAKFCYRASIHSCPQKKHSWGLMGLRGEGGLVPLAEAG